MNRCMPLPSDCLFSVLIVYEQKTGEVVARPLLVTRRTMSRLYRSVKAILCLFFLTSHSLALSVPIARSPTINFKEREVRLSSSSTIQKRAVHLNGAMSMTIGGDWYARFSSMTMAMSAGIAANNLEQFYSRALGLTDPGYQNSPLHRSFGVLLGNLELVFESADPAYGVPWPLIHAFLWQARQSVALGLAVLYAGQLRNSAGQAVNFALRLRGTPSGSRALG